MDNLKNIIPWGLIAPFLIIVLVEYGLIFFLNFYNKSLENEINKLNSFILQKQDLLQQDFLNNPIYQSFSQIVNIVEIFKKRDSLVFIINKFNQVMPKFLTLKDFSYYSEKKEIEINGLVSNWNDFNRFYKYVDNLDIFKIKEVRDLQADEKGINFNMVLILQPKFFQ
jgi:hypothetical protein